MSERAGFSFAALPVRATIVCPPTDRDLGMAFNDPGVVAQRRPDAPKLRPEAVQMDIAMPLLNGMEALRQRIRAPPEARVLMLSAHGADACAARRACRP
ncbi:MAG TPA: hypothetical protein VMB21_21580 [Candidatus Limnocylindria bacterium]|nr:hypothetical protein [Candidatus Limnocylindria bacterium]